MKDTRAYKAILFDLDNTLYDYDAYWRRRLAWALEPAQAAYAHLNIDVLIIQAMRQQVYIREFMAFLWQSGIHNETVCAECVDRYRQNDFSMLTLYPDTMSVLQTLRQYYRTGLITNGPSRTQRPKIAQFGLEHQFDVLLVSEEAGAAKPEPAIFHIALQQLALSPGEALYVGDSLESDLAGAQAAGIDFVWMNPQQRPLPVEHTRPWASITQLGTLLSLLGLKHSSA